MSACARRGGGVEHGVGNLLKRAAGGGLHVPPKGILFVLVSAPHPAAAPAPASASLSVVQGRLDCKSFVDARASRGEGGAALRVLEESVLGRVHHYAVPHRSSHPCPRAPPHLIPHIAAHAPVAVRVGVVVDAEAVVLDVVGVPHGCKVLFVLLLVRLEGRQWVMAHVHRRAVSVPALLASARG